MDQEKMMVGRAHDCLLVLSTIAQRKEEELVAVCALPYLQSVGWFRDDIEVALERLRNTKMIETSRHSHRGAVAVGQCADQLIVSAGRQYIASCRLQVGILNWRGLPDRVAAKVAVKTAFELPLPASEIVDLLAVAARPVLIGNAREQRLVNVEQLLVRERICKDSLEAERVVEALETNRWLVRVSEREADNEILVTHSLRVEKLPARRLAAI